MTSRQREDVVAIVVAAAGGELTGRVRLQKVVYLLDRLGLESGFDYDYHHYGPYSRDLDNATADAQAFNLVEEKFAYRNSDGARYSMFVLNSDAHPNASVYGKLGREKTESLVTKFARTNVTVLELAATVDWLWREERIGDWLSEVTKRKNVKVQNGRLDRAIELLNELGLTPPTISK